MAQFTDLKTRRLWYDGTNQVTPEKVPDLFLLGVPQEKIVATEINEDIKRFNQLSDVPLASSKDKNESFDMSWDIPEFYQQLNLSDHLTWELDRRQLNKNEVYINRVKLELVEIADRNIEPLIKTLLYIVSTLRKEGKIWGVGRGSSCASLVLHLIGVHEVDPVKYNIPLEEFFH